MEERQNGPGPWNPFTKFDGFLPEHGNMLVAKMTVQEAKGVCQDLAGCLGFTFQGSDELSDIPGQTHVMHFRNFWEETHRVDGVQWTSYKYEAPFTKHYGFLEDGGDLLVMQGTVDEAKVEALDLPGCCGFTFQGADSDGEFLIRFKSSWSLTSASGEACTSYRYEGPPILERRPSSNVIVEKVVYEEEPEITIVEKVVEVAIPFIEEKIVYVEVDHPVEERTYTAAPTCGAAATYSRVAAAMHIRERFLQFWQLLETLGMFSPETLVVTDGVLRIAVPFCGAFAEAPSLAEVLPNLLTARSDISRIEIAISDLVSLGAQSALEKLTAHPQISGRYESSDSSKAALPLADLLLGFHPETTSGAFLDVWRAIIANCVRAAPLAIITTLNSAEADKVEQFMGEAGAAPARLAGVPPSPAPVDHLGASYDNGRFSSVVVSHRPS